MTYVPSKVVYRSALGVLILLGCIVDHSKILQYQTDLQNRSTAKTEQQKAATQEESRLARVETESDKALSRAKLGCVQIIQTINNKPSRFNEQFRVFDAQTFPSNPKVARFDRQGNPINGVRPLPQDLIVCNTFGDTAIVGEQGYLTQIYRVAPNKLQEFRSYLKNG